MENIANITTSIQNIINSPYVLNSVNFLIKFVDTTSNLINKIAETVSNYIEEHGDSDLFLYKIHMESKNVFKALPWPKIILIICLTLLFIKIIQTTFSWLYKSVKFMMKSLIISVAISMMVVWLLENGTEKLAVISH